MVDSVIQKVIMFHFEKKQNFFICTAEDLSLHPHFSPFHFALICFCCSLPSLPPDTHFHSLFSLLCKHLFLKTLFCTLCPLLPFQKWQIYAHSIHNTTMTDMYAGMRVNADNTRTYTHAHTLRHCVLSLA